MKNIFSNKKKKNRVNPGPHQPGPVQPGPDPAGLSFSEDRITVVEPLELLDVDNVNEDLVQDPEVLRRPSPAWMDHANEVSGSGDQISYQHRLPVLEESCEPDTLQDKENTTDQVKDMDPTSGPSPKPEPEDPENYGRAAELGDLDGNLNFVIEEFGLSFSENQLEDMEVNLFDRDSEKKLVDVCQEVSKLVIKGIANNLDQVLSRSVPQDEACCQDDWTDPADEDRPSEMIREAFGITYDDIKDSVQGTLGDAFYGLFCSQKMEIPNKVTDHIANSVTEGVDWALFSATTARTTTCRRFGSCRRCHRMLQRFVTALNASADDSVQRTLIHMELPHLHLDKHFDYSMSSKHPKDSLLWWSCYNRWWLNRNQTTPQEPEEEEVIDDIETLPEPPTECEMVHSVTPEEEEKKEKHVVQKKPSMLTKVWRFACRMRPILDWILSLVKVW